MRLSILTLLAMLALACAGTEHAVDGELFVGTQQQRVVAQVAYLDGTMTVAQAITTSCSTTIVNELTLQLIAELNCMTPGTLVSIDDIPNVEYRAATQRFMQAAPARALRKVMQGTSRTLTVTSALRSLPQQLLLYRWSQVQACGISIAASPSSGSNHQSGNAFDTDDTSEFRTSLEAQGFTWFGAGDPVHFDYTRGNTIDLRMLSVRAFQHLWNRAHPQDLLVEDGAYGPATERRLLETPVCGFREVTGCGG